MLRDRLLELSNERHVSPCVIAQVEVALGNPGAAIAQLDRAVAERDADLIFLGVRRTYMGLETQARFETIKAKIGV